MEEMPPGSGNYTLMDVHGAGAQRSDPKTGNPANYPYGNGPQGDVVRIYNFARLVRDADSATGFGELNMDDQMGLEVNPNPATNKIVIITTASLSGVSTLQIINLVGSVVYSNAGPIGNNMQINISDLQPGIYFLTIKNNGECYSKKFIKK
jgi:hypothetical protein